jgi:hypothetical protein
MNETYVCDGTGCPLCSIRFKCFTWDNENICELNWEMIKTDKKPRQFLEGVTHSKVYEKGTKEYQELIKEL